MWPIYILPLDDAFFDRHNKYFGANYSPIKSVDQHQIKLTNTRVASCDQHHLVREVTSLQDVQSSSVSIKAFWFHNHILDCECLPWVKICGPLVNVTKNNRRNRMLIMTDYEIGTV